MESRDRSSSVSLVDGMRTVSPALEGWPNVFTALPVVKDVLQKRAG
jgi:hypothetical protein